MFERFTKEARAVVTRAQEEAREQGAPTIDATHLLLALSDSPAMAAAGVDRDDLLDALRREERRSLAAVGVALDDLDAPVAHPRRPAHLRFASSAKLALERALRAASAAGHRRLGAEHVLLGVLAAETGTVPRALAAGDVDAAALERAARARLERDHT